MKYEAFTKIDGALRTPAVREVPSEPSTTEKAKQRLRIQNEVFDLEDSVADNDKIISLLLTMNSRLYDVIPEEQKAALSAEDRQMIEYTLGLFKTTETRADTQFAEEGMVIVDKILARQGQISSIIKGE